MLRRLSGRKVSGQMQKRTHIMPVMGGRTGKDGKRQMGLAIAFIICGLLASITLQIVVGTVLMEEIHKLRGEQGMIFKKMQEMLIKQLETIQETGDAQTDQQKAVLEALIERAVEQDKKTAKQQTELARRNEELFKIAHNLELTVQTAMEHSKLMSNENKWLTEENRKLREGSNGDEI